MNKPFHELSELTRSIIPKNIEKSSTQMIMMLDLMGKGTNDIADELGMTASRISVIKCSPLYQAQLEKKRELLHKQILDKKSSQIAEDGVDETFKAAELEAAQEIVNLLKGAKNEFVRRACASDVLNYRGRSPKPSKKTTQSVEVTEPMADRFSRILERDEPTRTVKITTEVTESE